MGARLNPPPDPERRAGRTLRCRQVPLYTCTAPTPELRPPPSLRKKHSTVQLYEYVVPVGNSLPELRHGAEYRVLPGS